MKKFRIIWLLLIGVTVLVFAGVNIVVFGQNREENGRLYRVEINRICRELETGEGDVSLAEYDLITEIIELPENADDKQRESFFRETALIM